MAYRRFLNSTLTRQISTSLLSSSISTQNPNSIKTLISIFPKSQFYPYAFREFSSKTPQNPNLTPDRIEIDDNDDSDDEDDDDEEEDYSSGDEEEIDGNVAKKTVIEPACFAQRSYNVKDKILEAADIGYKVVGPLNPDDRLFKHFESVFAVVQIGSHQFKVSNGDCIYVEKLKYCEVNDKLVLNKVMLMGSPTQTIIGRPILPEAAVHAIVEEHALDAKVIIFKKKRRKNYRRTKGHRQELTRLRITDIQGIEKVEAPLFGKLPKAKKTDKAEKAEKVAVPV